MLPGIKDGCYLFKLKDAANNYSRHLASKQGATELTASNLEIVLQFFFVSFILVILYICLNTHNVHAHVYTYTKSSSLRGTGHPQALTTTPPNNAAT